MYALAIHHHYVERFRRIEAPARSREQAKGWDYAGWRAARADEKAVGI